MYFVLILLLIVAILFVMDQIRPDLIALSAMIALVLFGILDVTEALSSFSNPTVVMIAALFVVSEGLSQVGITSYLGNKISSVLKKGEANKLTTLLISTIGVVGSFMSSTGIVALFVPIVQRISKNTNIPAKKVFIPVAYAGLISGMMTLIATAPNLILSEELEAQGFDPFSMLSFTPIGIGVLITAIIYFAVINSLKMDKQLPDDIDSDKPFQKLIDKYNLQLQVFRFRVNKDSPLIGSSIEELELRSKYGINLLGKEKSFQRKIIVEEVKTTIPLESGDTFYAYGPIDAINNICGQNNIIRLSYDNIERTRLKESFGIAEIIIPYDSSFVGNQISQIDKKEFNYVTILTTKRIGKTSSVDLVEHKLAGGETLLVWGTHQHLKSINKNSNQLVVLNAVTQDISEDRANKAPIAMLIAAVMVVLLITNIIPPVLSILLAAIGMVASGCISMEESYQSVSWRTVFLVAALLPFSEALQKTGGVELFANLINQFLGSASPIYLMTAMFLITAVLSMFISNTATAVILAPISIQISIMAGISPYPIAMTVAIAASAAFVTPVSSPVNMLVVTPGGYGFKDFFKKGMPLLLLTLAVCLILIPIFFPF